MKSKNLLIKMNLKCNNKSNQIIVKLNKNELIFKNFRNSKVPILLNFIFPIFYLYIYTHIHAKRTFYEFKITEIMI